MKKILTLSLSLLFLFPTAVFAHQANAQTSGKTSQGSSGDRKRGPVFRANKDQVNQAQSILKNRGFYSGEPTGKLDPATRAGLREYQKAEGLRVTGTLNKITLEKMGIELTDKQKAM
ncbi:MAG: peptidoglycan-binding domain-containing protein [Pyrinomonadaceae bacterium]